MLTTFRICIKKETANAAQFLVSATDLHLLFAKQMQNREKLRRQKGSYPDFQLCVHMHCPGHLLILGGLKRKTIDSFYMNAPQAVSVCTHVSVGLGRKG